MPMMLAQSFVLIRIQELEATISPETAAPFAFHITTPSPHHPPPQTPRQPKTPAGGGLYTLPPPSPALAESAHVTLHTAFSEFKLRATIRARPHKHFPLPRLVLEILLFLHATLRRTTRRHNA